MTLSSLLLTPDADGRELTVLDGGRRLDRAALVTATARCVQYLRSRGVVAGDRVLAIAPHDVRGLVLLAAASALGVRVVMPYNLARAALPEWLDVADRVRPDHVVVVGGDPAVRAALTVPGRPVLDLDLAEDEIGTPAPLVPYPEPVEEFLVLFSSGSTGTPKAICVSEELVCRRIATVSERLGVTSEARIFVSGLVNNTTGVIQAFGALLHGATLIYPTSRDVATWPRAMARHRATHVMLRPMAMATFVEAAAAADVDLSAVRCVAYGAAAVPTDVLERARTLLPCDFVQGYGLSETYGPFSWLDERGHAERRHLRDGHSVGRPDDTVELRLEPVAGHPPGSGEVLLRSEGIMAGYFDPATGRVEPPGEWFRTGDIAAWSDDGDLLLRGRVQASILSPDGHRIYPEEVEAVLARVPDVREVVLVGLQDEPGGAERPVACLTGPVAAYPPAAVRDLLGTALRASLSPEKWPDAFWLADTPFPRGDNDKVRRAEVRAGVDPTRVVALAA